jgi:hypothetical protein
MTATRGRGRPRFPPGEALVNLVLRVPPDTAARLAGLAEIRSRDAIGAPLAIAVTAGQLGRELLLEALGRAIGRIEMTTEEKTP